MGPGPELHQSVLQRTYQVQYGVRWLSHEVLNVLAFHDNESLEDNGGTAVRREVRLVS